MFQEEWKGRRKIRYKRNHVGASGVLVSKWNFHLRSGIASDSRGDVVSSCCFIFFAIVFSLHLSVNDQNLFVQKFKSLI